MTALVALCQPSPEIRLLISSIIETGYLREGGRFSSFYKIKIENLALNI